MFVQASSIISPSVSLATLGSSCRYVVKGENKSLLIDCGNKSQGPLLLERLKRMGHPLDDISFISTTSLDRLAALTEIKQHKIPVLLSPNQFEARKDRPELKNIHCESHPSNEVIDLGGGVQVHRIESPGCSVGLQSFLVTPDNLLIADSSFGIFRGGEMPAPSTLNVEIAAWHKSLLDREINGLALPMRGALTGELWRKYITDLGLVCTDLTAEYKRIIKTDATSTDIFADMTEQLFTVTGADAELQALLLNSAQRVWGELQTSVK